MSKFCYVSVLVASVFRYSDEFLSYVCTLFSGDEAVRCHGWVSVVIVTTPGLRVLHVTESGMHVTIHTEACTPGKYLGNIS